MIFSSLPLLYLSNPHSVLSSLYYVSLYPPALLGGTCPNPVEEQCEGQSCPIDMQCVRASPTAPSVCQCLPDRMDQCAGDNVVYMKGLEGGKYIFTV